MTQSHRFGMMAKTLYGLEDVLCKELEQLGAQNIEKGRRIVHFEGDKRLLYKANLHLRTALRILVPIATFEADDADKVYDQLNDHIEWDKYLDPKLTFAVDTVVYSEHFTHSKFVAYRTKDAIADYFTDKVGRRPNVSVSHPDILFHVHISHTTVTVALDSSGDSLHMRGYRVAQTDAPINEVLAAGILLLAGWDGQTDLIDPMCGSGTIPIEAALIAKGIPAGLFRKEFAFEKWKDYDADLFTELVEEWEERPFNHQIYASDIFPKAVQIARANAEAAGVSKWINFAVKDVNDYTPETAPKAPALLVTNPPYGERLRPRALELTYEMLGSQLKHTFTGYKAWVISSFEEGFHQLGLKPFAKEKLFNGQLECELRGYETFEGKRKEHLQQRGARRSPRNNREGYRMRKDRDRQPDRDRKKGKGAYSKPRTESLGAKGGRKPFRPKKRNYHND